MNEQGRVEALDGFVGKGWIDVHDVGGFVLFVLFALLADFGGDVQPECERQKQEQALQPFLMDGTAEFFDKNGRRCRGCRRDRAGWACRIGRSRCIRGSKVMPVSRAKVLPMRKSRLPWIK